MVALKRNICVSVLPLVLGLSFHYVNAVDLPVAVVVKFSTSAQSISCEGWNQDCNENLAEGFRTMVETAIVKTKRMTVMERTRMETLLQEQAISESGLIDDDLSLGGLQGISYVVYGTISRFGQSTRGVQISTDRGVGSLLGRRVRQAADGGLNTAKTSVEMEIDLKITDAQTSEIVVVDYLGATVQLDKHFQSGASQMVEEC